MYKVEVYAGFSDKTWEMYYYDIADSVAETEDIKDYAIAGTMDIVPEGKEVVFIDVNHIEYIGESE